MNEGGSKRLNFWQKNIQPTLGKIWKKLKKYYVDDFDADDHWIGTIMLCAVGCIILWCVSLVRGCCNKENAKEDYIKNNSVVLVGDLLEYPDTDSIGQVTYEEFLTTEPTDSTYLLLRFVVRSKEDKGTYLLKDIRKENIVLVDTTSYKVILQSSKFAEQYWDRKEINPAKFIKREPRSGLVYIQVPKSELHKYLHGTLIIEKKK